MSDERDPRHIVAPADEAHGALDLPARIVGTAERRMLCGRLCHLRVRVRRAEAMEVECPDVEACRGKLIAPRTAVETVGDRQGRGKGRAMDIQHDLRRAGVRRAGW